MYLLSTFDQLKFKFQSFQNRSIPMTDARATSLKLQLILHDAMEFNYFKILSSDTYSTFLHTGSFDLYPDLSKNVRCLFPASSHMGFFRRNLTIR